MHIDWLVAGAGLFVGLIVGLTGMGGGALMTPILVLVFRVQPLAAIGSDLLASLVMKPVGAAVHSRQRSVRWDMVRWLVAGWVPTAFAGVLLMPLFGQGALLQERLRPGLGAALLLASAAIVVRSYVSWRRDGGSRRLESGLVPVRPLPTLAIGAVGGLLVGMTSVGAGSVMMVMLLFLYPTLTARRLVGTDIAQAVPLVGAAALGHALFGDLDLGITASILVGSIPGVYVGSRLAARTPEAVIRPLLVVMLVTAALKLVNVSNEMLTAMFALQLVTLLPLWWWMDRGRRRLAPAAVVADQAAA